MSSLTFTESSFVAFRPIVRAGRDPLIGAATDSVAENP
jgi:hypothetical protein